MGNIFFRQYLNLTDGVELLKEIHRGNLIYENKTVGNKEVKILIEKAYTK